MKTPRRTPARTCPATLATRARVLAAFLVHVLVIVLTTSAGAARVANRDAFDGLQMQGARGRARATTSSTTTPLTTTRATRGVRASIAAFVPGGGVVVEGASPSAGDDPQPRVREGSALESTRAGLLVGPADHVTLAAPCRVAFTRRSVLHGLDRARGPPPAS